MLFVRLLFESFRFAVNELRVNLMRTILSLLGVTIGIFAIIGVLTVVDSLESSLKASLAFIGDKVIRVEKFPWIFTNNYAWWEYYKRPQASYEEFEFLQDNLTLGNGICLFAVRGNVVIKHENNSIGGTALFGVTYGYSDVYETPIEKGRYFSPSEVNFGNNVAILGAEIASGVFGDKDPVGKQISIKGLKFTVIGVMKRQGENLIDAPSNDDFCIIPYIGFKKLYYSGRRWGIESIISVKGRDDDVGLVKLENEIRGYMRSRRGLRPIQEDNFALNRPEAFANIISSTFDVIGIAGWVIGSFSILVGGFGIANIMFVSVKERTHIIGIQKSLGAKNYFILFQFLFEAIFLSLLGGGIGLLLVYLITILVPTGSLELVLSIKNIILGLGVSSIIGMVSGIVPAALAARLDPVIAIRTN
ncbi:MAG: ABC transporter permease [Cyclobacteriaceae bacterium]|jgi:putative ABC transport system permease protein